jgi:hypothetical protein
MAQTYPDDEAQRRLPFLYDSATDLEVQLEDTVGDPAATLTPGQLGAFNQILADARALLPNSVALREDVAEATADTRPAEVHRALNTTLVPTLHNALPPDEYEKRR